MITDIFRLEYASPFLQPLFRSTEQEERFSRSLIFNNPDRSLHFFQVGRSLLSP
jgi:hypothetical protein